MNPARLSLHTVPSLPREGASSGRTLTGGTGSTVWPLVNPMVTVAEELNLYMLSTTSRFTTSGQPAWFLGLQSSGRKTSWASVSSCSRAASLRSPCSSRRSKSSLGTGPGDSFRKYTALRFSLARGRAPCREGGES